MINTLKRKLKVKLYRKEMNLLKLNKNKKYT